MKNRIVALSVAVLGLASADAFASVARQAVLGTADPLGVLDRFHGSFYIDDNYNIFYNPSYANDFKNWAAIEKDNANNGAEGGFVAGMGTLSVGVFMNRTTGIRGFGPFTGDFDADPTTPDTTIAGVVNNTRPIDLIIAGDMGVKWGLGVTYGSFQSATDVTATQVEVNAGVQVAGFEPFASFVVSGDDEVSAAGVTNEFNRLTVGTRYRLGEWTPYAAFASQKNEAAGSEDKSNAFGLGIGRNSKMSESATLNYAIGLWRDSSLNRNVLPIDVSVEAQLTSWLAGRAGVTYNFVDRTGDVSATDSTTARLGASFMWDKVSLDWAVGGGTANGATGNINSQSFDFANGLFSYASLNYKW